MIALYGLAGSRSFAFRRVPTRAAGEAWLDERAQPETQESLNARRQSSVVTERVARTLRWQDGSRIVDDTLAHVSTARTASDGVYRIDDEDGNEVCDGLNARDVWSAAIAAAERIGAPVYVSGPGVDDVAVQS